MQILNQPTEPTTTSYLSDAIKVPVGAPIFWATLGFTTSDETAYWLYNKDVPIPKIPKCVSSRIHSDRRLWGNGKKIKTAPVIDKGWNV